MQGILEYLSGCCPCVSLFGQHLWSSPYLSAMEEVPDTAAHAKVDFGTTKTVPPDQEHMDDPPGTVHCVKTLTRQMFTEYTCSVSHAVFVVAPQLDENLCFMPSTRITYSKFLETTLDSDMPSTALFVDCENLDVLNVSLDDIIEKATAQGYAPIVCFGNAGLTALPCPKAEPN